MLTATSLAVVSLSTFQPLVFFPTHLNITAACWSVKGKQIVVGMRGGGMAQFTPEGEKKAEIAAPVSLQGAGWDGMFILSHSVELANIVTQFDRFIGWKITSFSSLMLNQIHLELNHYTTTKFTLLRKMLLVV